MPSENDLRDLFASTEAPNTLDARRIITRSRARRLPKQLAAGSIGALAVVGVVVLGVQITQLPSPVSMTAGEAFDSSAPAPEIAPLKRAPADKVNLCTGTLAEIAPSQYGLRLDVAFPASAPVGTEPVAGTVRLTNTSDREVVGTTPATPAITLSRDGVVLWHSNGPTIMMLQDVTLAPGESLDYAASFTPVVCAVEDDSAEAFRDDLPAVAPGEYQVSAATDVTVDGNAELVTGPTRSVRIG